METLFDRHGLIYGDLEDLIHFRELISSPVVTDSKPPLELFNILEEIQMLQVENTQAILNVQPKHLTLIKGINYIKCKLIALTDTFFVIAFLTESGIGLAKVLHARAVLTKDTVNHMHGFKERIYAG